jgi:sugar phosphate isomerase/epimerase
VLPGDGTLPLVALVRNLEAIGFRGPLSLELFSEALWAMDPVEAAKLGMSKVRRVLEQAHQP